MTDTPLKQVRVIAGPTGPTGTYRGVNILDSITGPTGLYPQWGQLNTQQMGTGMSGPTGARYETVYPVGASFANAPTGTFKTVIISGYTGPA